MQYGNKKWIQFLCECGESISWYENQWETPWQHIPWLIIYAGVVNYKIAIKSMCVAFYKETVQYISQIATWIILL